MGDFVMGMILTFDQGKPDSAIFDEAAAETLAAFQDHFKGVKVVSTDPLVIETYDDLYQLDAEVGITTWMPNYSYGPGAWHNLALGIQADAEGKLAFSADKAEKNTVEWMSYIAGPSLEILKANLDAQVAAPTLPYAATLGQYVTAEEAAARFANLAAWYEARGNFWLGTGPFYLYRVFPVEQTVTLQRNPDFPDMAEKWARFGEPLLATVEVDGAGQVPAGTEAVFDVFVTAKDAPYPSAEVATVKYLVFDGTGALVGSGDATMVAEGQYQVTLGADVTGAFTSGAYKLEVAVAVKPVSLPAFGTIEFVVP
jgi:peptide/nickel transport system substrate-binding protein